VLSFWRVEKETLVSQPSTFPTSRRTPARPLIIYIIILCTGHTIKTRLPSYIYGVLLLQELIAITIYVYFCRRLLQYYVYIYIYLCNVSYVYVGVCVCKPTVYIYIYIFVHPRDSHFPPARSHLLFVTIIL